MEKRFIAFGNQKGGSGKSTMCALFADYLAARGTKLAVADFDYQGSLVSARKMDLMMYKDRKAPYRIKGYRMSLEGSHTIRENMEYINRSMDEIAEDVDVVLLDTPGNLNEDNLMFIFHRVDVSITPFGYDRNSWDSLKMYRKFLRLSRHPRNPYRGDFDVYFTLNMMDSRIGKADEHELWTDMDLYLSQEGTLTPPLKNLVCLRNYNTLFLDEKKGQAKAVAPCFDFLYKHIFTEQKTKEQ